MKHFGKRFFCGVLTLCMLSSFLCTFASARSSAYLNSYRAILTPKSGGLMAVTVDVSGVGSMDVIGASTIYIYESTDGKSFTKVATYKSEDFPAMLGSGTTYYKTPVTYLGIPDYYYYASVYCYAEKDGGSDTGHYDTAIKKAIH